MREVLPDLGRPSIDLTIREPQDALAGWNPLSMTGGRAAHEVVTTTVDALAASLGWGSKRW